MNQLSLFDNPQLPAHQPCETSRAAAAAIQPKVGTLKWRVLDYIRSTGKHGATAEEVELECEMRGSTVRPRLVELENPKEDQGPPLIRKTGRKRKTQSGNPAEVYEAIK